jgi:hypothetical protein
MPGRGTSTPLPAGQALPPFARPTAVAGTSAAREPETRHGALFQSQPRDQREGHNYCCGDE